MGDTDSVDVMESVGGVESKDVRSPSEDRERLARLERPGYRERIDAVTLEEHMTETAAAQPAERVDWTRVAIFYGIAFGIACAITAIIYFAGGNLLANKLLQLAVAFLYMPAPLIAGLVVERIAGRGYLIRSVFKGMRVRLPRLADARRRLLGRVLRPPVRTDPAAGQRPARAGDRHRCPRTTPRSASRSWRSPKA